MIDRGSRTNALTQVRRALDGRRLIWFGIRGEDGEALLALPEFQASYAITAPVRSGSLDERSNVTLERIRGTRPDLDCHDIDLDLSDAATEFRRALLREVAGSCVVMTYRPAACVSALAFSMSGTMQLAGLFKDRQVAFEHKPWVETSLAERGVQTLGWQYVPDEDRGRVRRMLSSGPVVLRASRRSGGVGVARLDDEDTLDESWPSERDAFVAAAPYLADSVPVNVSGCVFPNAEVRAHPPSVQLVGLPSCTDRPFGYCGNDFAAPGAFEPDTLERLDEMLRTVGHWLFEERYLGAFGVDALVQEGRVVFTEVNARFQGSSAMSALIATEMDVPDLFTDHLTATLGLNPVHPGLSLATWAREQPPRSHVVAHSTARELLEWRPSDASARLPGGARTAQLPWETPVEPGATLFRLTMSRAVTHTGFEIDDETEAAVAAMRRQFSASGVGGQ